MAVTQNSYVGNGTTTTYSFTFPYLKAADIKAQIDANVTTAFTLPTATTLQFNTAPANGTKIKIYRETDDEALTATFYAGSSIKSEDLNDNATQNLYATQEINARYLSNLGGTMVGDLTMGEDAEIIFEGATDDAYETTLTVADPTADRTITLPNVTGTVITTGDTGSVTSAMIADGTIVAADIANDAIDSQHYAADSIDTEHYAANSVDTTALAADAVTGDQIANDSIDSEHYADGSIDEVHLANGIITFPKMAVNSVASTNIVDDTIVNADIKSDAAIAHSKLANVTDGQILVGNGSNVPTAVAVSGDVTLANTGAVTIATGAVEHAMLAADAVDGDNIANDSIDSEHIVDLSIDEAHLAAGIVTHPKLAVNSVASTNIVNDTIVDADIKSDAAISQSKIALDAELTTLAGMQSGTASVLASGTTLTSTLAELNLLDGKSIVTTISSPTDVQIPTAQAVDERIVDLVTDVGGFRPIANETSFPATNPDPEDNAGTIVSVKALASNLTSNGSGVATIANGAGSGNTVTINGMANSDTIEAGKGILVETTSTLHTYTFHRETLAPADVTAAQTAVNDFNQRYQVTTDSSTPSNQPDGTALAEGDLWFDGGSNTMKVYDGSSYAAVTSVGDYKLLTVVPDGATSGSPDYTNLSFDLRDGSSAASITSVGQLLVSVNGVLQKPNSTSWDANNEGFHLEGTNGIKFCTAPGSGASVFVTLIGSATTVNTPATNSVAEATIQTNVVSEEKLKVSNGPTNGYFLQAQSGASGGLTWAEADTTTIPVADESTDTSCNVVFVTAATGSLPPKTGTNLTFNSNTGQLSATSYAGDGSALTGVASSSANGTMYKNTLSITDAHTIAATEGAHSVGPISVGNTVTVSGRWVIS